VVASEEVGEERGREQSRDALLGHLNGAAGDAAVQPLQQLLRQALTVVDAAVVVDELVEGHLLLQLRVVRVLVEEGRGQQSDLNSKVKGCVWHLSG
jgi:hypothetical protein